MKLSRRACLSLGAVCFGAACSDAARPVQAPPSPTTTPSPPAEPPPAKDDPLEALERTLGGRVGVYARHTETGAVLERRSDEVFAMCSTFKWALAAAVLARVDAGELALDREVSFTEADLLDYAPTTRAHVAEGKLTVEALAEAAVTLSDNTAANLLLDLVEGPEGLTRFLRAQGDERTRLDRTEPTLNTNLEGDPRDTTTPRAMAGSLEAIALGAVLKDESRARLVAWLRGCRTCDKRLWAGLPDGWRGGTKTGTCDRGAANDVGLIWSPSGETIVIASYLSGSDAPMPELAAAQATIAGIVVERFR